MWHFCNLQCQIQSYCKEITLSLKRQLSILDVLKANIISQLIRDLPIFFFSGEISGVGVAIEDCTSKVWDLVFQPIFTKVSLLKGVICCFFT